MSRQVLSSYRRDDFAEPEGFLVQLGMVLERYPDDVIRFATSPLTGIQRKCKFPPSIAEIVEECDKEVARTEMIKRYGPPIDVGRERELKHQHWATVFVASNTPPYADMVAKASDPKTDYREFYYDTEKGGIWVVCEWLPKAKMLGRR